MQLTEKPLSFNESYKIVITQKDPGPCYCSATAQSRPIEGLKDLFRILAKVPSDTRASSCKTVW